VINLTYIVVYKLKDILSKNWWMVYMGIWFKLSSKLNWK